MKWETTKDGYRVPRYTEEEKRNHVPHWCADVITEEEGMKIRSEDIPERITPELLAKREATRKMIDEFFAEQSDNSATD